MFAVAESASCNVKFGQSIESALTHFIDLAIGQAVQYAFCFREFPGLQIQMTQIV